MNYSNIFTASERRRLDARIATILVLRVFGCFFSTLLATVSHRVAGDGDDTKTIAPDFLARLGSDLLATAIKVRFEKFFFSGCWQMMEAKLGQEFRVVSCNGMNPAKIDKLRKDLIQGA